MNATEVLDILQEYYELPVYPRNRRGRVGPSPWAFLREVRMGTGKVRRAKSKGQPKSIRQRMDAWAFNTWPSCREAIAFEVKVSRADFLCELKQPRKREAAMAVANRFYFVTANSICAEDEIPADCGWIYVDLFGTLHVIKEAPYRPMSDLPMSFISSILRRVSRMERHKETGNV